MTGERGRLVSLWRRARPSLPGRRASGEAGDTLVELLVTTLVVAIAGAALLGGLLTSASASTTHRNVTNLDAVLHSFAEAATADVDQQLRPGSPCVGTYPIAGAPLPASLPPGSPVTVFVAGFAPSSQLSGSLQPSAGGAPVALTGLPVTSSAGSATVTFVLPGVSPGPYQLTLSDASGNSAPGVGLSVQASGAQPPSTPGYGGYTLSITHEEVDPGAFLTPGRAPCQLSLTAVDDEPGSGASGSMQVVVANLTSLALPTVVITPGSTTTTVGQSVSLVATVVGSSGVPTGTIAWSDLPSGSAQPNCSPPGNTLVAGSTTCTVTGLQAGSWAPTATYSGDSTYTGGAAQAAVAVQRVAPLTFTVTPSTAVTTAPGTVSFTATLTAEAGLPTPTGSIEWTAGPPGTEQADCSEALSGGSATCTVTGVPAGGGYTMTAGYSGDQYYLPGTQTSSPAVTVLGATVTVSGPSSPQPLGSTLGFTASVAGSDSALAPTGTVSWSFPSGTPAGAQDCPTAVLPATPTCTVTAANAGSFTPTATYTSADGYPGASGSDTVSVSKATPAVAVSGSALLGTLSFTATVSGVSGVPPTGSLSWSISPSGPSCTPATSTLPSDTFTCTGADPAVQYEATALYGGDSNYDAASGTSPGVDG